MTTTIRPFDEQGRYTEFHNYVLDCLMPKLSPNAWKCLCFIIRKTKGWHKDSDDLSFSQIKKGTGIKSDPTISKALKELEQLKCILVGRNPDEQWASNTYRLNTALEIVADEQETVTDEPASTIESIVEATIKNIAEPTIDSIDTKETIKPNKNKSIISSGANTPEPPPVDKFAQLRPDTEHSRLLFEKLKAEFEAKGRHPPGKFPTLACKEKFDNRAELLKDHTGAAIDRALQIGILQVARITDFIAKWDPARETGKGKRYDQRQNGTTPHSEDFREQDEYFKGLELTSGGKPRK